MAYFAMVACAACKAVFGCNPHKVPAVRIAGEREPVCRNCIEIANQYRADKGLEPFQILPGAYEAQGEPTDTDWKGEE